jgi:peptidyl-tRNA hydrolase
LTDISWLQAPGRTEEDVAILEKNYQAALRGNVRDDRPKDADRTADPRIWIFVRCDIDIPLSKLIAQGGHAADTLVWRAVKTGKEVLADEYMACGQAKLVKRAKNADDLRMVFDLCTEAGILASIVTDAALTHFERATLTVASVGPCRRADLPKKVDKLQMLTDDDIVALTRLKSSD